MKTQSPARWWLTLTLLCLVGAVWIQGEEMRSSAYVVLQGGQMFMVTNNQSALLDRELTLTPELTVTTNGIMKIAGKGEKQLAEGRKVTLDGFWMNDDGMLVHFKPHYMLKDRRLVFVDDGIFNAVAQDVTFKTGSMLKTDGTFLTPDQRMIRLQDGQAVTAEGEPIAALDHVQMKNGKLILQKDGSIIPLPAGRTIGMSDGTTVNAGGVIVRRTGEQITLQEGQRFTLPGPVMPAIK